MEPESADVADVDAHHRRETAWRVSLLLGSAVAALVAAFVAVGPVLPPSAIVPGVLGHAMDASALFTVCSLFVAVALLVQWPIDDRLRRLPLPLWVFAVARGLSLGLVAGAVAALVTSAGGLWLSAPQFFVSGAIVGLWIGAFGAIIGAVFERARGFRIAGVVLVLVAGLAGIVTVFLWRSIP